MWRRASSEPYRYRASERAHQIPIHVFWVSVATETKIDSNESQANCSAVKASWLPVSSHTTPTHKLLWAVEDATLLSIFPPANDYIIRGTEIYSGYRYSEIFWDILRYFLDIPVATAIASRGVLGTSMTPPARNIKNPGPGMPASIVLYLLPCKCRTEL